ncbi:hypothetical protein [Mesorhizobium sp. M0701]|uniref:hypothetical protein n=1 Tax=Mesorhizobium sp. M0701 TaxID=2956989 RepID=UPI00333B4B16
MKAPSSRIWSLFLVAGTTRPASGSVKVPAMETIVHPKRSAKDIEQMAAKETAAFLRRASITYLECCVSLMMTHLQREEVAAILEKEADMLRRLD